MIWLITFSLIGSVSLATFLLSNPQVGVSSSNILLAPNLLQIFANEHVEDPQIICGVVWFFFIMPCAYPWLRKCFLNFTPIENDMSIGTQGT
jgi:hypothetical protein